MPTKIDQVGPAANTASPLTGPNYPATVLAGDYLMLWVNYEGTASNNDSISGWGSKVLAVGGGAVFKSLYIKTAVGGETGAVGTITATGATYLMATVVRFRVTTGGNVIVLGAVDYGVDTTSGTAYSATSQANFTTVSGGLLLYDVGFNNTTTRSGRGLTQTGATFGANTAYFGSGVNMTEECGHYPVTTGAAGATITQTFSTLGTASTGLTAFVMLSEASPSTTLVVAGIAQAQAVSAAALTQDHQLAVTGLAQVPFIQGPVPLTQLHQLAVAGLTQAQALSVPAVVGNSSLAVANVSQVQFIQAPVPIFQDHQLLVAALAQGQLIEAPTLGAAGALVVAGIAQGQVLGGAALMQSHQLAVAGIIQGQSLSGAVLAQLHQLVVSALAQAQTLNGPSLSQTHGLLVAGLIQAQSLPAALVTQVHQLAASGLTQAQQISAPSFTGGSELAVAGISQGQQLGTTLLEQAHQVVAAGIIQAQHLGGAALVQVHEMFVAALTQQQTIAVLTLSEVPEGGYSETVLTVIHTLSSGLVTAHPQPDLTPSNVPSSHLEVSHGV